MRARLAAIAIAAYISPVAFAGLTITVEPDLSFPDTALTGSFEVFVATDETHAILAHGTQLSLSPVGSGITFTSVEPTTTHPYIFPDAGNFFWQISPDGATVDVSDIYEGTPPNLDDGDGLFKVNFDINPGTPPYPVFDLTINPDPLLTGLIDGSGTPLSFTTQPGQITIESTGPHVLQVDFQRYVGSSWVSGEEPLVITYRDDPEGLDVATGWEDDKFAATVEGDFGIYTRSEPFGPGDEMLITDARARQDTSNVLIETYTNQVDPWPETWVPGVTWNEGGRLALTVISDDKEYFDDFRIVQKLPGRFLDHAGGVETLLGDVLDASGQGSLPFDRVGCPWFPSLEADWWIGPFASFDLIPDGGTPWVGSPDTPLVAEMGAHAIFHVPTPEPSSFALLAMAALGLGAYAARRRKKRITQWTTG